MGKKRRACWLCLNELYPAFLHNTDLPWAMLLSGFIIGIPVFFEVGLVILLPLVISIRKSTKVNILLIGIPVLAGLSIVHGLVPNYTVSDGV